MKIGKAKFVGNKIACLLYQAVRLRHRLISQNHVPGSTRQASPGNGTGSELSNFRCLRTPNLACSPLPCPKSTDFYHPSQALLKECNLLWQMNAPATKFAPAPTGREIRTGAHNPRWRDLDPRSRYGRRTAVGKMRINSRGKRMD
ncbi:hypothetical protein ACLOJK_013021 [Asimina triloba]